MPDITDLELPSDYQEGELIVSHSMLAAWQHCQFAWDLSYLQGWKPVDDPWGMSLGGVIHRCLARHYSGEGWEGVKDQIKKEFLEAKDGDVYVKLKIAAWVLDRYCNQWAPSHDMTWEVVDVERHFIFPLITPEGRKYWLQGYIDIVARDLRTSSKLLWVWDHKSSQSSRVYTPLECLFDLQLPLYASGISTVERVPIEGLMHNLLKVYDYKNPEKVENEQLFRREEHVRTPIEMNNLLANTGAVVDQMYDSIEYSKVRPRSLGKDCAKCRFNDPCLMGLKGFDVAAYLETDPEYRQKESYLEEEPTQWDSNTTMI